MTELEREIVIALSKLRPGEVVSYGDIAAQTSSPKAARAVGKLLAKSELDLPWWRVIRADGTLLKSARIRQTRLLEAEDVCVEAGRVLVAPLGRFARRRKADYGRRNQ